MTINFPACRISDCRFGIKTNTLLFQSPLSGSTQRLSLPGARWEATYTLTPHNKSEAGVILAFLVSLDGSANSFYGFDPDRKTPQGTGNGTPLVNGGSQVGSTLVTDGWANSETVLKAGDYFQVGNELKMITEDITSDGSGNATLVFKPVLRSSPADNASIITTNPKCIMRLVDDNQAGWDTNLNSLYGFTFSAVETFV